MGNLLKWVRDLGHRDPKVQAFSPSRSDGFPAVSPRRLGSRRSLRLRLAGAQKDFPAGAKLEHFAPAAIRFARITPAAPVPNEPVTPVCPVLARHELHQIELNLHRI